MNNLRVVLLLLSQILALHVIAHDESHQGRPPLPVLNPFEHKTQTQVQLHHQKIENKVEVSGVTQHEPSPEENKSAEAPQIRRLGKHHSTDKSVAGGGVIIGGLVTAIFAAVFCYIRVTRRRDTRY
ncbi:hypothetical protein DEO72_LG3g2422 [Vigna unguiculata]|uniref:Transmembrane protein n=1 Tax=Vigna unguiculata TaxID=3917 RepID=A0A4D6LGV3_VIGUN|nr:hypothetical protein DEO72_LG3g2422 [Vigna unguiculata]